MRGCAGHAGADMTNSVMDRVAFDKADLSDVKFHNAVITGATFIGTNLQGASFDEALIGGEDAKRLCAPFLHQPLELEFDPHILKDLMFWRSGNWDGYASSLANGPDFLIRCRLYGYVPSDESNHA